MFKRAWKPLSMTVFGVGGSAYLYYSYFRTMPQTFNLPVRERGADGKQTISNRVVNLLTNEEVDARLNKNADFRITRRQGGLVWKRTTASLPSNDPIEDASANAIVERDPTDPSSPGDLLFFSVMDGHSGPHTSRLLSKILLPAVATELSSLVKEPNFVGLSTSMLQRLKSIFWTSVGSPVSLDADPKYFSLAIQSAFTRLDSELTNAPLRLFASESAKLGKETLPDLKKHPMALPTMSPALSGSCALLAVIDTAHKNLYVACTGDSRAVAGVWEEGPDGSGKWRVEVLSEDQTGRNENEVARIRAEHPPDEAESVIQNGRVLGGLEPARAFGDARYKWTIGIQGLLSKAFMEDGAMRIWPGQLKTPPYVTSKPEVTHRKLSFLPLPQLPLPAPKSALRFLILATDGLWDQLSSEDAVALVGGHLAGIKGSISKSELSKLVPTTTGSPTVEGKVKATSLQEKAWAFVDDNVSTHLIRNAFGGADSMRLRKLVSIPAPYSRRHRDDITVTVVWWEDGREDQAREATFVAESLKAKL